MNNQQSLENIIVVLYRPRKLVNIGGTIRAMKNMGLHQLRLVQPSEYNEDEIEGIAHRSADVRATATMHPTLDEALHDATYVAGTTSRPRTAGAPSGTLRGLAPGLIERAASGPVAIVFGSEDNGLSNAELDRCHSIVSIATDPAYPSLNLAQAVLLVAYELRQALDLPPRAARRQPEPRASASQLEQLFGALEQALWAIEFFKNQQAASTLRTLRGLVHRAAPDAREAALLRAIALETLSFLRRKAIEVGAQNVRAAEAADE